MPASGKDESKVLTSSSKNSSTCAFLESVYEEVLRQNPTLHAWLDQIKRMEQNPLEAERAKREVAKLERDIVRTGIYRGGQGYYPARYLLGSKRHGVEWKEAKADVLKRKREVGQFGCLQDVYFVVQKGAEVGIEKKAVFHLAPNTSAIVYVPEMLSGKVIGVKEKPITAKYVYVEVSRNGKVVGHPSLTIKPAPPVWYVEEPVAILALEYQKISHLADDVPKIAQTVGVSEQIVAAVKEHLFLTEHIVQVASTRCVKAFFTPDETIADLWLKAVDGTLNFQEEALFKRTLAHEYVERGLMAASALSRWEARAAAERERLALNSTSVFQRP